MTPIGKVLSLLLFAENTSSIRMFGMTETKAAMLPDRKSSLTSELHKDDVVGENSVVDVDEVLEIDEVVESEGDIDDDVVNRYDKIEDTILFLLFFKHSLMECTFY